MLSTPYRVCLFVVCLYVVVYFVLVSASCLFVCLQAIVLATFDKEACGSQQEAHGDDIQV